MLNIKRVISISILLVLLFSAVFPALAQDLDETLEIEDYEFTMDYPEDWDVSETQAAGQTAYVLQDTRTGTTVAIIFVPGMGAAGLSLEDLADTMAGSAGLTLEDSQEIIIGGEDGLLLTGSVDALEGSTGLVVLAIVDDALLVMTMIDPRGESEDLFIEMINSIEVDGEGSEVGGSSSSDEDDKDDSKEDLVDGDELSIGDTVEGEITEDEPQVEYIFEGEEGDIITITVIAEDGEFDPTVALLDEDGDEIAYNDDAQLIIGDMSRTDSQIAGFELPDDGVYTIVVSSFAGAGEGDYTLSLEEGAPEIEAEEIAYGDSIVGEISEDEPVQFYVFEGEEGDVVLITMTAEDPRDLDTTLEVLDSAGNTIAYNDDDTTGEVDGTDSFIEVELPEDGVYYIRASRFIGEGEYELTLDVD